MPSRRDWFKSELCHSEIYVERTTYTHSDGMPGSEPTLLATVCRNGQRFDARIYVPEPRLIRGFLNLNAAKAAVCNHLSMHEDVPKRQLP